MLPESLRKLIGGPAKDTYSRNLGGVLGISVDTSGQPVSVGIDQGNGVFAEYHGPRVTFDGEALVLIPSWKLEADRLKWESGQARKRAQALDELLRKGEIPKYVHEDLCDQYNDQINKLQKSSNTLLDRLQKRVEELDRQRGALERFLGNIKVQFRTGEIDEQTFTIAATHIMSMLNGDKHEKEDIIDLLGSLKIDKISEPTKPPLTTVIATDQSSKSQ